MHKLISIIILLSSLKINTVESVEPAKDKKEFCTTTEAQLERKVAHLTNSGNTGYPAVSEYPFQLAKRAIAINSDGNPVVPRGSKSFIAWRSRTPIDFTDDAFVWQSAKSEDSQLSDDQLSLAGYPKITIVGSVGKKITIHRYLNKKARARVRAFYGAKGELFQIEKRTSSDTFDTVYGAIKTHYGSMEQLFARYDVIKKMEMDFLDKYSNSAFVYFIDDTGYIWLFYRKNMNKAEEALENKTGNSIYIMRHEIINEFFISQVTEAGKLGFIDYGMISIDSIGHSRSVSIYSRRKSKRDEMKEERQQNTIRDFDTEGYFSDFLE